MAYACMFTTTKVKSAYMPEVAILYQEHVRTSYALLSCTEPPNYCLFETQCMLCTSFNHLLNADDVKVILNEGMPHHKNPFDKGRLIINFKVGVDGHLRLHQ